MALSERPALGEGFAAAHLTQNLSDRDGTWTLQGHGPPGLEADPGEDVHEQSVTVKACAAANAFGESLDVEQADGSCLFQQDGVERFQRGAQDLQIVGLAIDGNPRVRRPGARVDSLSLRASRTTKARVSALVLSTTATPIFPNSAGVRFRCSVQSFLECGRVVLAVIGDGADVGDTASEEQHVLTGIAPPDGACAQVGLGRAKNREGTGEQYAQEFLHGKHSVSQEAKPHRHECPNSFGFSTCRLRQITAVGPYLGDEPGATIETLRRLSVGLNA